MYFGANRVHRLSRIGPPCWQTCLMHERAGLRAEPSDLIDVDALLRAFTEVIPDPAVPAQRAVFGTSGHRGTALNGSFNEAHIAAISLAPSLPAGVPARW